MNTQMLKLLVDLTNSQVDVVDNDKFFSVFKRCQSTTHDLKILENAGFISLLFTDDQIENIGVNQKAIDYINSRS